MIDRRRLACLTMGAIAAAWASLAPDTRGWAADAPVAITEPNHVVWRSVAATYGLDPMVLYAISVHESGRGDAEQRLRPWPYSINTPRGPVYAADEAEARRVMARWGHDRRLDVGLMQLNLGYHRDRVPSPAALVEPATNIRIAAEILSEAIAAEGGDVWAGVGRYHSADPKRAQRYVTAVSEAFRRVKADLDHGLTASALTATTVRMR